MASPELTKQLGALSTALALLPSILIIGYASMSCPPDQGGMKSAAIKLLPTAMFTSSLGVLLFLPDTRPADYVVPLIPLSLMTCMRGGKDEMGDDEGWQWSVMAHNVVAFV